MAGVTNPPFRRLCRESGLAGARAAGIAGIDEAAHGGTYAPAGLYVTEMVTSRALVERHPETLRMVRADPLEHVRSVQLYGVDPATIAAAVRFLVEGDIAD
ncbi:MAG TPA: tRNA-dihydrouridine synthase, partial [Actinomycetaceae bacterium]|nr:tRNA-dihydrouridine synthase [Actinomycetaceae bacterium]